MPKQKQLTYRELSENFIKSKSEKSDFVLENQSNKDFLVLSFTSYALCTRCESFGKILFLTFGSNFKSLL